MGEYWIETCSGVQFSLSDPRADDVYINDIAHGLSLLCRYVGQCRQFYSVAEHSVLCAKMAEDEGLPVSVQMACLLHDAAEAYVGDLSGPLKALLRERGSMELDLIESRVLSVILEGLGLIGACRFNSDVGQIDRAVLAAEVGGLMMSRGSWVPDGWPQAGLTCRVIGLPPEYAEAVFLKYYNELKERLGR